MTSGPGRFRGSPWLPLKAPKTASPFPQAPLSGRFPLLSLGETPLPLLALGKNVFPDLPPQRHTPSPGLFVSAVSQKHELHYFLFKSFFSTHTGFSLNPELVNCLAHRIPPKVGRRLNIFPIPLSSRFLGCHTHPGKDSFNPSPLELHSTTTPLKKGNKIKCSVLN